MTTIHDFNERLIMSEKASDEPFWEAVYKKAFPNYVNFMPCPGDTKSQRMGIDRVILLANGKIIKIDEKKREQVYPDILLEYISVDNTNAPGWIEKDLAIDYLAYAFMPTKKVYLFPWDMLRRTWLNFRNEWKKVYKDIPAQNKGYVTHSIAVPIKVLQESIKNSFVIQLDNG
jgi:hypothetical protein